MEIFKIIKKSLTITEIQIKKYSTKNCSSVNQSQNCPLIGWKRINFWSGTLWIASYGILLPKLFWPTAKKNCSSDKENFFEIRGWRLRICKIFESTWTIYSNRESSEQILVTECFLTCSWRFLISNKLEQLEFKLEKIIGI